MDRNSDAKEGPLSTLTSPSSRRAWIEISKSSYYDWAKIVALLAEGVDRNRSAPHGVALCGVALLAEGVDRNNTVTSVAITSGVALLAEGVDRNAMICLSTLRSMRRPPRGGRG